MVEPVDDLVVQFAEAGASVISFHPEATRHVDRTIHLIRDHGCQAGLVLNPATPIDILNLVLDELDLVLLMSVNPGFGGQKFIPYVLEKIAKVRKMIDESERTVRLEVDGGIKLGNIGRVARAGADTFVSGSGIFNSRDYEATITKMKERIG